MMPRASFVAFAGLVASIQLGSGEESAVCFLQQKIAVGEESENWAEGKDAGGLFYETETATLEGLENTPQPNDMTFQETACFDQLLVDYMKLHQIRAASAAVMRNGKLVYTQGYGTADVPQVLGKTGQLVTSATPFRLASVSKPITAIAIMVAQQRGWLGLDDKVFGPGGRLHDLVQNPKPGFEAGAKDTRINQVTIRHLLQHTGGWMGQSGSPKRSPMFESRRIAQDFGIPGPATCLDTIKWMLGSRLDSTPGTVYSYSNLGYCTLGHLLEVIAKKSYEQVVQELVLVPAGIDPKEMYVGRSQLKNIPPQEVEYDCVDSQCNRVSSVFPGDGDVFVPYGGWHHEALAAHGGWVASGRALLRFMSVMAPPNCGDTLAPCLLTSASFAELTAKPSVSHDQSVWYGFGFQARQGQDDFVLWHAGSLSGTLTNFVRADTGYSWALLFNRRGNEMQKTHDALGWNTHQCVRNNWPRNFVGPPPKTTPKPPTLALCPGWECTLSGQSCLEDDGYCCGTDLIWHEGMCTPLTTPTTPAPTTAPPTVYWKLESGPCTIDAGNAKCVLSPNFPSMYPARQSCKFGSMGQGPLDVQAFNTEQNYDKLNVNGQDYSGNSGPTGVIAQGFITWTSDDTVAGTGWKICSGSAVPTPAPKPSLTPAPTPTWTCSLSHTQLAQYCANVATYPFMAATHDCHYSWYHSSASAAVSSCSYHAGDTCYVYDQYGTWCR